jgi:hypothetical protein
MHMAQDDPCSSAFENDVIADHVRTIGLGRGHVSRAVFREHDSPLTRRQDRIAIDENTPPDRAEETPDAIDAGVPQVAGM